MKAGAVEFEDAELVFVAIAQPLVGNAQNLFVDLPLGRGRLTSRRVWPAIGPWAAPNGAARWAEG
jgi:hypothetical protein